MLGNQTILSKVYLVSEMCNAYEFDCHEPAVLHVPLIQILVDGFELLPPIDVGVAQISVGICRASPEFVGIGEVNGEHAHRGKESNREHQCDGVKKLALCGDQLRRSPSRENE